MNANFDFQSKPGDEALTVAEARRQNPRFFLGAGILLIAIGILAIALITLSGLPADRVGVGLFAASGLILLAHALSARGGSEVIPLEFVMALLHLGMGFVALLHADLGPFTLAQWLAMFLVAEGAVRIAIAFNFRGAPGARSVAANGALELFLAVLLFGVLAAAGSRLIGFFVGADLLLGGSCMVTIFRTARVPCPSP